MVFEHNPDRLRDLPPVVGTILEEFVAALDQAMGPQLESVILFGSAAEGRLRATSDVNLLVIAREWTLDQLDSARSPLRAGRAAAGLTVMFLKSSELRAAVESFAVKFADIKARHRVLLGTSPFDSMVITREASLRRVQQVLLNLELRLRERYVVDGDHEERLEQVIADVTGPIRASAATLMALQDGRTRAPKTALEEIFADGSRERCLREISAVHRGEHLPAGAARTLFADVLDLIADLAAIGRNIPVAGQ
jgi:predicted nucleotidyltransferase